MSTFVRADVTIHYRQGGRGFPVLLLAPGGMNSTIDAWERAPFNPLDAYADDFRLVAMDQRNAGSSSGPLDVTDPWGAYAYDQLQLMDHVACETFHVIGMCIGCAYALKLVERAPERVAAAVLLQPIGILDENREIFEGMWRDWGRALADRREDITAEAVDAFGNAMWREEGFVGSVSRAVVRSLETPMLVMPGVDPAHPVEIAREIAALAPGAALWDPWRDDPERVVETVEHVRRFLHTHAAPPS